MTGRSSRVDVAATPTVDDEGSSDVDRRIPLAHIVNPFQAPLTSDLRFAQPITFESMRVAKAMAEQRVRVRQFYTCYDEDREAAPEEFEFAGLLRRSVLDVASFPHARKLPILSDILGLLYAATDDSEHLVYTNVDISLTPSFYLLVASLIDAGFDAFVINPRMISTAHTDPSDLPFMYAEVGKPRLGWDCFVFPRSAYPKYRLGNVCIGTPLVGRALLLNLVAFADNFAEFKDIIGTFHLGKDSPARDQRFAAQKQFNLEEVKKLERHFRSQGHDLSRYDQTQRVSLGTGGPPTRHRFRRAYRRAVAAVLRRIRQ